MGFDLIITLKFCLALCTWVQKTEGSTGLAFNQSCKTCVSLVFWICEASARASSLSGSVVWLQVVRPKTKPPHFSGNRPHRIARKRQWNARKTTIPEGDLAWLTPQGQIWFAQPHTWRASDLCFRVGGMGQAWKRQITTSQFWVKSFGVAGWRCFRKHKGTGTVTHSSYDRHRTQNFLRAYGHSVEFHGCALQCLKLVAQISWFLSTILTIGLFKVKRL